MYFHELDIREKITSRLQLPLALTLASLSVFGFIIKGLNYETIGYDDYIFVGAFSIGILMLLTSSLYFVRAYWGHTYQFIPTPILTENYRKELVETYEEFNDCEGLVSKHLNDYLYDYFSECASDNTSINDTRSEALHMCNTFLLISFIPLLITFTAFNYYKLDVETINQIPKIVASKPVDVIFLTKIIYKERYMSKEKTPTTTTAKPSPNSNQKGAETEKSTTRPSPPPRPLKRKK